MKGDGEGRGNDMDFFMLDWKVFYFGGWRLVGVECKI